MRSILVCLLTSLTLAAQAAQTTPVPICGLIAPRVLPSVSCIAFDHSGRTLLSGTTSGHLRTHRVPDPKVRSTLRVHEGTLREIVASPDGMHAATVGADGNLCVVDLRELAVVATIAVDVLAVGFSGDGKTLRAITKEGEIVAFDPVSGALRKRLPCPDGRPVTGARIFGDVVVQAYADGCNDDFGLVEADSGKKVHELAGGIAPGAAGERHVIAGTPELLAFLPIFVQDRVTVFDVKTRKVLNQTPAVKGSVIAAAVSGSGARVVTLDTQGVVTSWDPKVRAAIVRRPFDGKVRELAADHEGVFAAVLVDGQVTFVHLLQW